MTNTPTTDEVRAFCAKHAFGIGQTFPDETLSDWVRDASSQASRLLFRCDRDRSRWVKAHVCRECCDAAALGPDPHGFPGRRSFYEKFDEMLKRLGS